VEFYRRSRFSVLKAQVVVRVASFVADDAVKAMAVAFSRWSRRNVDYLDVEQARIGLYKDLLTDDNHV